MEAVAKLRNCPMSARKMRLVIDNIRGKNVSDALNILKYTNKEAAYWLDKVLRSAIANWSVKTDLDPDSYDLYISRAFSDEGKVAKRFQPAPQGRAHRILKRSNHITIFVDNRKEILENASEEA